MPNQPTQSTQFYGFVRSRQHFIWRNPDEVAAPAALSEAEPTQSAAPATSPAEVAPSTSTELVRAPRDSHVPSPEVGLPGRRQSGLPSPRQVELGRSREPGRSVQAVIDALIAQPPPDQQTPEPQPVEKRKRRNKKRRRPKTVVEEPQPPSPAMHEAQCMICNSDYREEMDELFVNWHNVSEIAREYNTPRRTVYRHAHATGLFPIRDRNLRRSLGLIIHRAETVPCLTADTVIRAVRTLAHINESGEWVNPPTHVVVSSGKAIHANKTAPPAPELLDTPCQAIESVKP
jgi:hypothetical protein